MLWFVYVCRKLTSGEMKQTFDIIRDYVGDYQEDFIQVLNHLFSSDISWFEFLSEERKIWNKVFVANHYRFINHTLHHYIFISIDNFFFNNIILERKSFIDSIIFQLYSSCCATQTWLLFQFLEIISLKCFWPFWKGIGSHIKTLSDYPRSTSLLRRRRSTRAWIVWHFPEGWTTPPPS